MANTIKVSGGFSVGNSEPIDDRIKVATIAERNAIVSYRRYVGLETTVLDSGDGTTKKYQLQGGVLDTNWVDITTGGSIQVRDTNATPNTIPLRDSNGNFVLKLQQGKIFVGNSFGNAQQVDFPDTYPTAGQILAVNTGKTGFTLINPSTLTVDWANIFNKPTFATVATTGSYNDLTNKPTIPSAQIQSDWNQTNVSSADYIKNKPLIPSGQLQSDWNQTVNTSPDYIKNKPTIPAAQVQSDWNASSGLGVILNKPTWIPSVAPGANTQVIFNDNGAIAGNSGFRYDKARYHISGLSDFYTEEANVNGNTAFGFDSGYTLKSSGTGIRNTLLGSGSGRSLSTGVENVFGGFGCGYNVTTGNSNIFIGPRIGNYVESPSISNKLAIDSSLADIQTGNYLIEGNFSSRWIRFNGINRKRVSSITASGTSLYTGTVTAFTGTSITDSTKTFTANGLVGKYLVITSGLGAGKAYVVSSNTTTSITITNTFNSNIDTTSNYKVVDGTSMTYSDMSREYLVDLTSGDAVVQIPTLVDNIVGSDVAFTITANPSNNKLYILTSSQNSIKPGEASKYLSVFTSPFKRHVFFAKAATGTTSNDSWSYYTEPLGIVESIKLQTNLSNNNAIQLDLFTKIYKLDVSTTATISFVLDSAYSQILANNALTFELHINMTSVSVLTFPGNVSWIGGMAPTFGAIAKYNLEFRTLDGGTTWLGLLKYTY